MVDDGGCESGIADVAGAGIVVSVGSGGESAS